MQEEITVLNVCIPQIRVSESLKPKLMELKVVIGKSVVIPGACKTSPLSN